MNLGLTLYLLPAGQVVDLTNVSLVMQRHDMVDWRRYRPAAPT
jgi:hypothetical protein